MSSIHPILALVVLAIVAGVLLAPIILLKIRSGARDREQSVFNTMGTLRERAAGSMVPAYRFDVFSDGLLISGIFYERYISAKEIESVTRTKSWMKLYIEIKLMSGEALYLATGRNKKLLDKLTKLLSEEGAGTVYEIR